MAVACQPQGSSSIPSDPHLVKKEIYKTTVGDKEVYGVRLFLTSTEFKNLRYMVRLAQNDKVWIDTLTTEVPKNDTLESELIFSEAQVNPNDQLELETETLPLE